MKKRLTVLPAAFLLLALTACSSAAIEDSNGPDDTAPAVITPGHTQFSLDGLKGDVSLRLRRGEFFCKSSPILCTFPCKKAPLFPYG